MRECASWQTGGDGLHVSVECALLMREAGRAVGGTPWGPPRPPATEPVSLTADAATCWLLLPALHFTNPNLAAPLPLPYSYFGLGPQDITTRIDAAFNSSGYTIVSDNEHVYFVSPQLQQKLAAQPLPRAEELAPAPAC